ncbi:PH domain-containing protein [Citricoccus sp. NPDC055426]|uniref:PH domain-containing protein n=1 Tax=Citricoccus sp. NPDC055426 TaxID=3155536 RepID=UPI003426C79C
MGLKLAPGEQVRVRTRSHPRALTGPILRLMLIALATSYVQGLLARPDLPGMLVEARGWLVGIVWILAAAALFFGCLRPAWRWLNRRTLLTTRRIIQRTGIGASRERALHLLSVYDVRMRQRRGQRMSQSGDLMVDHGSGGSWVLANMPEAVRFRELILLEVGALRREIALQGGAPQAPMHAPMQAPAQAPAMPPGHRPAPAPAPSGANTRGILGGRGRAHRG